ncbi:hypothetical protein JYU34_021114 [Plutella xylostella]|uniref:Secreted protein n=1 Tax=Plutella xylostella TaxID=51655 RepID=A0ABQ7PWI0_PLUXY|nr:hypothetical protein JYU34_021114 [Plutella xylostella]
MSLSWHAWWYSANNVISTTITTTTTYHRSHRYIALPSIHTASASARCSAKRRVAASIMRVRTHAPCATFIVRSRDLSPVTTRAAPHANKNKKTLLSPALSPLVVNNNKYLHRSSK